MTVFLMNNWLVIAAVAAALPWTIQGWAREAESRAGPQHSPFTTELKTEPVPGTKKDRLTADLVFEWIVGNQTVQIVVEKGFETDYASIPPFLHWWLKPTDPRIIRGAVLHDYLYWANEEGTQQLADSVLRYAMYGDGARWSMRVAVYGGLRLFGWAAYIKHRKRKHAERDAHLAMVASGAKL